MEELTRSHMQLMAQQSWDRWHTWQDTTLQANAPSRALLVNTSPVRRKSIPRRRGKLLGWKMIMTDGWCPPASSLYHLSEAWSLGNLSLSSSSNSLVTDSHLWGEDEGGGGEHETRKEWHNLLQGRTLSGKHLTALANSACARVVVCRLVRGCRSGMCSLAFTCLPLLCSYFRETRL